jgi:hypothetical protein
MELQQLLNEYEGFVLPGLFVFSFAMIFVFKRLMYGECMSYV